MRRHELLHNAVAGLRATGELARWLAAVTLRRCRSTDHRRTDHGRQSTDRRRLAWCLVQAVLGPGALALTTAMWLVAVLVVSTPLWWRIPSHPVVFVPVIDTASSFLAALCGLPLVLLALACGYGLPRWQAAVGRTVLEGRRASLSRRVQILTESRTGALETQAAELRRIERDLHDGAQARLVSAGLLLGLLDVQLDDLPGRHRELLTEARVAVGTALQELRDLVHGVYPPILVDRGLTGGIESLTARVMPLVGSVTSIVDVPDRLPAALESTVYFTVAEALANVVKHSGARTVNVAVRSHQGCVSVEVEDDGRGSADELRGSGLAGLRRRAAAFDGTLSVTSPAGGPTVLRMELPCV